MLSALLDGLARDLLEGAVVPWLGPGVHEAPAFPASPAALAAWIAQRAPVPGRIRGSLGAAAQYVEQHRHRKTLDRILVEAFARPSPPPPAVQLLERLPRLPLVVDTWYDATCARALAAERRVALVHGVDRTGQLERFFVHAESPALVPPGAECDTVVYQPVGTAWPRPSFVVSDADLVEVLTEIDIQTPIPPVVQARRAKLGFVFLGCRFNDQLPRAFARQIMKRSAGPHFAVLPDAPTRMEARFLAEQGITRIAMPLAAVAAALTQPASVAA